MKKAKGYLFTGITLLVLFALFTVLVMTVDVQPIGPENSSVGFASINGKFRDLVGRQEAFYQLSQVAGYAALLTAAGFAVWGLSQMIRRKSLKMDSQLWFLVALYGAMMACYVGFEFVVINCRPVLEEGVLEASYPSSHTLLGVCIMGSAMVLLGKRIPCRKCRWPWMALCELVLLLVVVGRTLSGVHWLTDIIASLLLGGGLVALYAAAIEKEDTKC